MRRTCQVRMDAFQPTVENPACDRALFPVEKLVKRPRRNSGSLRNALRSQIMFMQTRFNIASDMSLPMPPPPRNTDFQIQTIQNRRNQQISDMLQKALACLWSGTLQSSGFEHGGSRQEKSSRSPGQIEREQWKPGKHGKMSQQCLTRDAEQKDVDSWFDARRLCQRGKLMRVQIQFTCGLPR